MTVSNHLRPTHLLLQWHLSDRCNLRCAHCYQHAHRESARSLADWHRILDRFLAFLEGDARTSRIPGHINVTGGEPFALRDLPALLDTFTTHRAAFGFGILSNGTLVDRDWARRLKHWRPRYVQVSVDGTRATHDAIRGEGRFDQAVAGIAALVAARIPVVIAFTAHRANWREFPEVASLGRDLGVARVWADRLIPEGEGGDMETLTPYETREFFELMRSSARIERPLLYKPRTEIAMKRALQFLAAGADGARAYRCTAGSSLLTVMPDGTVYPCRRLPLAAGNVFDEPLADIYGKWQMAELRDSTAVPLGCQRCLYATVCGGGLRCLSHALDGDWRRSDPGCWIAAES